MTTFTTHTNPKGTSMNREQKAHRTSTPNTGLAATLSNLGRSKGTGAPSQRRLPLAVLCALALFASLAFASSASAAFPASEMGAISNVSYASAEVEGKVNPEGGFAEYHFEYCPDSADCNDGANWASGGGGSLSGPTIPTPVPPVTLTGLKGGTKYFVRLAANFFFQETGYSPPPNPDFTTLPVDPPTITTVDDASEVLSIAAKATGKVKRSANPDPAFDVTACRFEYISDAQFTANQGNGDPAFKDAASADCENFAPITEIDKEVEVSAQLTGLKPETTYHLRLVAENASPTPAIQEAANTFTTPTVAKPTVTATDDASEVVYNSAKFTGKVLRPAGDDPGLDVNCRFEYISDAQFLANEGVGDPGFTGAQPVNCVENPITADKVDEDDEIAVSAKTVLSPETTYHLRLVAENVGGTDAKVAANTFTTPEADLPTVTIDPVADGIFTIAHVTGTVTLTDGHGSAGLPILQVSSDGGATWSSSAMLWSPTFGPNQGTFSNADIRGGEGLYIVKADLTGLQPSTTYLFRIAASYNPLFTNNPPQNIALIEALGEVAHSPEPNPSVTTEPAQSPPTAEDLEVTDITATSAHFSGTVNPQAPPGPLSLNPPIHHQG